MFLAIMNMILKLIFVQFLSRISIR